MTEPDNAAALPAAAISDVIAVLKMCDEHDIPLEKLPKLWDEHQQLQQVERRAGIQNGNMDREITRLRGLTAELDKQVKDADIRYQDLEDRFQALLLRCKHFEGLADQQRIDDLEDLISHYRCGMEGMKAIDEISWFSPEFRLSLIRKALYTFEPTEVKQDA
ncbi:hypothetical protein ACVOZ6_003470 [Escherichia coli]